MEQGVASSAGRAGDTDLLIADSYTARLGRRLPAYTYAMRLMHWGTAALMLCTFAVACTIDNASSAADRAWLLMIHRSLGVAILFLTVIRLVIRHRTSTPPLPADLPVAQHLAARVSTVTLYALLAIQPLLGLTASLLHGERVIVFGSVVLPRLLPGDKALAHALFQIHGAAASVFLGLIGLHAAAALYHHFIRKDHVLAAMLPGVRMMRRQPRSVP